jgi:hypothetical protein
MLGSIICPSFAKVSNDN